VERAYLRTVDAFVFNGEVTRQSVRLLRGGAVFGMVAPPGGDRLGQGVTEAESDARAAAGAPLRVLFVGNLIPRKGLLTLLRALAMRARDDWRLTVVGSRAVDPAHVRQVDRFVIQRGLGERVLMKGHLDDGALASELRAAHVLAVPSAYEGFGIVYLEAMGFGVVPFGSTEGGASEVIEDGKSGFLVRPGDAARLAEVIQRLCADRELLRSRARAALRRFRQFPGWEARMKGVRQWLVGLLAGEAG
jgi:glycosyltransferase involved in cell wall biosynthesis